MILKALYIYPAIAVSFAIIAFDCKKAINPETLSLSLVDVPTCTTIKRNITKEDHLIQLIQPKTFDKLTYIQCLIEIDHIIYRCGKTFDNFNKKGFLTEVPIISESECNDLQKGIYKYEGITIKIDNTVNVNYLTVETFGSIEDGSCTPGSYDKPLIIEGTSYNRAVRISKFKFIVKKGIASVDIEDKKIITEEGVKCNYEQNNCFSSDLGYIYWEKYFSNPLCKNSKEYLPIFEGVGTIITDYTTNHIDPLQSIILHYEDYDYQIQLNGKTSRICNQIAYNTEHPKLAIIKSDVNKGFDLNYDKQKLGKNINIMTYFNSKLVYSMRHTKEQIDDLYDRISFDRCLSEVKIIQSMISIARINPSEFAYEYFGSPGYTANIRGEIIYITKCIPVSVNFTKIENKCFNEIPVIYNNNQKFILPRSHILVDTGSEIDCSSLMLIKYKIQNNWFTISPSGVYLTNNPEIIQITPKSSWTFQMINNFVKTGIYTQEDLDQVQRIIMMPVQKEAMTSHIYRGLKGEGLLPNGNSIINLLSEEDIEKLTKRTFGDILGNVYHKFSEFGSFISGIIGIMLLIRTIKFFLNIFINFSILYKTFGLSWKLILCWWENIVHHLLRKNEKNIDKKNKKKEEGILLQLR